MSRVLALSSWVGCGHVGLSAAVPVLQALGHEVTQLPTVMLSNHPGFGHVAGVQVPPEQITAMVEALAGNGWLGHHDALLTGYLPSAAHVSVAVDLVRRLRILAPGLRVVVDPVLGDAPGGLYIDSGAAEAIRGDLVPLADVLTPNLFELGWLTERPPSGLPEIEAAARALGPEVLVTSARVADGQIESIGFACETTRYATPHRQGVPNGVGDVFSALIAAGYDMGMAMGFLASLIDESVGKPHLRIPASAALWTRAAPIPPSPLSE